MNDKFIKASLRLFKAVPIHTYSVSASKTEVEKVNKVAIKSGLYLSDTVCGEYEKNIRELTKLIANELTLNGSELNNSLHKSWKKIKDSSLEELMIDQFLHYVTTYGFEALGIFNDNLVYIPFEKLKIPKIDAEKIQLVVINGYTFEELRNKCLNLITSGVALKGTTLTDIMDILKEVGIGKFSLEDVKNREAKMHLYSLFGLVPEQPIDFLRFVVFELTGSSLLIKGKKELSELKAGASINRTKVLSLLEKYEKIGLNRLAGIFYRFKPIFLALKESNPKGSKVNNPQINKIINKVRRLAEKFHKPMQADYLNSVTAMINSGVSLDLSQLEKELESANIFRKIRLYNSLNFRTLEDATGISYKIRNGKSYSTSFAPTKKKKFAVAAEVVFSSICNDFKHLAGRKIYIPENVNYTIPATEKQFIGSFPVGTSVKCNTGVLLGIHWVDNNHRRTDLDLSLSDIEKIGWDASIRGDGVLFSGDMTSAPAPLGASEVFRVKKGLNRKMVLNVNNYSGGQDGFFKLFVANKEPKTLNKNYMVSPNDMIAVTKLQMELRQKTLGLMISDNDGCTFYFGESNVGNKITSSISTYSEYARSFMINSFKSALSLSEVLSIAGADLVNNPEDCEIDLSPAVLERDSILNLLTAVPLEMTA